MSPIVWKRFSELFSDSPLKKMLNIVGRVSACVYDSRVDPETAILVRCNDNWMLCPLGASPSSEDLKKSVFSMETARAPPSSVQVNRVSRLKAEKRLVSRQAGNDQSTASGLRK